MHGHNLMHFELKRKKLAKSIERFYLFIGIIAPLMNVPQFVKIIHTGNATGISLISWSLYSFNSVLWLIYGIIHKSNPIIYSNNLWIILDLCVIGAAVSV